MRYTLQELIQPSEYLELHGPMQQEVSHLCLDSREARAGSLFLAMSGTQTDGHGFIDAAIDAGAAAVVCERMPNRLLEGVTYVRVADSARMTGLLAHRFFEEPSQSIRVVGITGTNGKTTVATLLYRLARALGVRVGLLSTIEVWIDEQVHPTRHTTPDAIKVHRYLHQMVEAGCRYCFMEVSSHALVQERVQGVHFAGGVFTNISHDHLDYHGTFDNYIRAKKKLFDHLSEEAFALVNRDDKRADIMLQNCQARNYDFALRQTADYHTRVLETNLTGMRLTTNQLEWFTPLLGRFNAYNLTAAYGVIHQLGWAEEDFLPALSRLGPVRGRFERIVDGDPFHAIVDYAHTPDALANILGALREFFQGQGKLITVVGCGGNRDRGKRPQMAATSLQYADRAVFTSDNPRDEHPESILDDMMSGVAAHDKSRVLRIVDREAGIRTACSLAQPGDLVVVAGKGHETYQEIKGERHPFDDRTVVLEFVKELIG